MAVLSFPNFELSYKAIFVQIDAFCSPLDGCFCIPDLSHITRRVQVECAIEPDLLIKLIYSMLACRSLRSGVTDGFGNCRHMLLCMSVMAWCGFRCSDILAVWSCGVPPLGTASIHVLYETLSGDRHACMPSTLISSVCGFFGRHAAGTYRRHIFGMYAVSSMHQKSVCRLVHIRM